MKKDKKKKKKKSWNVFDIVLSHLHLHVTPFYPCKKAILQNHDILHSALIYSFNGPELNKKKGHNQNLKIILNKSVGNGSQWLAHKGR